MGRTVCLNFSYCSPRLHLKEEFARDAPNLLCAGNIPRCLHVSEPNTLPPLKPMAHPAPFVEDDPLTHSFVNRLVRLAIGVALLAMLRVPFADAQTYRNIVNTRFRTVSNGPQSAIIVDVKDPNDAAAVRRAVLDKAAQVYGAQRTALQQEIAYLRRKGVLKPNEVVPLADAAIVRVNGKLMLPEGRTRADGPNELTFTFPTTGDGAWSPQEAASLANLANLIYTELRDNVYGRPSWNGNITVRNLDPRLGKVDEVLGALLVINGSTVEITFPTFSAFETRFLAMAQIIAQAMHGPNRISYDNWEIGMARAAAVVVARNLQPQITTQGQTVIPSNGFYFTPYYDLLNQPALANNTFTPPTKSNQTFSATTLSGMLVPRLQMSSTAWLKCYIENPNFFKLFNTGSADGQGTGGFNAAHQNDSSISNDVSRLRALTRAAVPNVEGQAFDQWFEQQYALDSSVIPGAKLFAYIQPTFPNNAQGDDSGAAIFLVYYRTDNTGDEVDLNGTANLVYWDYTFANRLFLPSFETANIANGFGSVSPFFNGIGGTDPYVDKMRIAIDVPVNKEYVRLYFPTGYTGTQSAPNDLSGVVVGADSGSVVVTYEGGGATTIPVAQGAFGGIGTSGSIPNGFSRTRLVVTPTNGTPTTFVRNTAFNQTFDVAPIYLLQVGGGADTFAHQFASGQQMISLPFKPLAGNLNSFVSALGLTNNNALLAQYRQDITGDDKYLRFPSLPPYQPGYALWTNFTNSINSNNLRGERTDNQKYISVPLQYGWTQIGPPYSSNLNVNTDLQFQYLGADVANYTDAIARGWIAAGIFGWQPSAGYQDITTTTNTQFPLNTLEVWKGYWIRVLVTEGLVVTYANPNSRAARIPTRAASPMETPNAWQIHLSVRDEEGTETGATFGQAPNGSDTYNPAVHAAAPPPLTRSVMLGVRFPHPDWSDGWSSGSAEFLTDIRKSGTRSVWNATVSTPVAEKDYTVAWSSVKTLPRGVRLLLTDKDSGQKILMNSASSYKFRASRGAISRSFEITAEPRSAGRVRVFNVSAIVNPAGGTRAFPTVTLGYELSGAAETTIQVRLNGRVVRTLGTTRAAGTGANQLVWDARDNAGRSVPAGAYTIEILAKTPEGDTTRAIAPLLLTR